jgi:hypothetical protein
MRRYVTKSTGAKNMTTKRKSQDSDPTIKELKQIKTLLMLLLIKQGAASDEINASLHINIRNLLPMKKLKRGVAIKMESA